VVYALRYTSLSVGELSELSTPSTSALEVSEILIPAEVAKAMAAAAPGQSEAVP
jgi:hypothetical protein